MVRNTVSTLPSWQPTSPPVHGETDADIIRAFHASILLPGLSRAFQAATLKRSLPSIAKYHQMARQAVLVDAEIMVLVRIMVGAIGPEEGLLMARQRGPAQLVHFSRQAICDFHKAGWCRKRLAEEFLCSIGTISNILAGNGKGYAPLSGERRLTAAQAAPSGRWGPRPTKKKR